MATVPQGTQLYHGSLYEEPVTGREWLAFEPEHAMIFTSFVLPREKGPDNTTDFEHTNLRGHWRNTFGTHPDLLHSALSANQLSEIKQVPLHMRDKQDGPALQPGWLHTYAAQHDLKLIYIDGMSAAKSVNGTLDSQDYILLNETNQHSVIWDLIRADRLCKTANEEYLAQVDGFLRMEGGFEIILCDFQRHLDTLRITRAKPRNDFFDIKKSSIFAYFQAIASRYHGIGKERVRLNYNSLVTAYEHQIGLFPEPGGLPRLNNTPFEVLSAVRNKLYNTVMGPGAFDVSRDWQAIADMIVSRYSPRLGFVTSGTSSDNRTLMEVEYLLQPFIDYDERDPQSEILSCQEQFLPPPPPPHLVHESLAAKAVTEVSRKICSTLVDILYNKIGPQSPASTLQDLVDWLDWSTWKECKGCAYDEICFLPIWPIGGVSDRDSPSCIDATKLLQRNGYWGYENAG
ncbi:MAG: hypothetical protein Q9160_009001 [Pyrenula sp. 1 TL-2023]